jgi:uncharacterized membrane protein YfcA
VIVSVSLLRIAVAAVAAFVGGIMNSVAGGGTLLTFPSLIAAGLSPLVANATSTVALLPGALSSMIGYRAELSGARQWTTRLTLPSAIGGAIGAWLLLRTPDATFNRVVPWLVLGATSLFLVQRPLMTWLKRREVQVPRLPKAGLSEVEGVARNDPEPMLPLLLWQALIGVYGGYFGAGVGILMLAALGFMGFTNIHRMNGLKNWGGFCMNLVAAAAFAFSGIVNWPVAISMSIGATAGGYVGSRTAQRLPPQYVRGVVVVIGIVSGIWLLLR